MYPAPHIHEHFAIHKWLRQTAHILTHNLNNLEHIANNCMSAMTHTDVTTAHHWARCAAFRCVVIHAFVHRTCGSSLALCVIPCHPCMRTCVWLLECSLLPSVSLFRPQVLLPPLLESCHGAWREFHGRSPVRLQLREHGHYGFCQSFTGCEPKDMEFADTNERNFATSSDIYFQNALDDTASFSNVPDVDDDELAEYLAVVVDRMGKPVEVRSNSDQFSCDNRNLKSAQSQSVKKFFITNYLELKPNKIAEFHKKSNCDNNRNFVKFINKILWNGRNCKNSKILPSIRSRDRSSSRIRRTLSWNYLEDHKNCRMK